MTKHTLKHALIFKKKFKDYYQLHKYLKFENYYLKTIYLLIRFYSRIKIHFYSKILLVNLFNYLYFGISISLSIMQRLLMVFVLRQQLFD